MALDGFRDGVAPSPTNYVLGLAVKDVGRRTATLYHHGRVVLPVPVASLLPANETFRVGPYFLSRSNGAAGKVTANPAGIPVQVFTAIDTNTVIIQPVVDEFSQLLVSYKLSVLDRPAGVPTFDGTKWTI